MQIIEIPGYTAGHVCYIVVCTGHSGIWDYSPAVFAHIDESAKSTITRPFDPTAPRVLFHKITNITDLQLLRNQGLFV